MPDLRGRLTANAPLSDITWFRVGGPAQETTVLQGKDHPLYDTASKMAKEYIKDHQAEMITRGQETLQAQHKRAG